MASADVTRLLLDLEAGKHAAFDRLLARVYDELREMADAQLRRERADHTLNATDLVHEAYIKLVHHQKKNWNNRAHFFGTAAKAMRRILVDYARAKSTHKRAGEKVSLTFAGYSEEMREASLDQVLEIDNALERLGELNDRLVRVVECRYFAGLTLEETAKALGVARSTVSEDWRLARAWLQRELS